MKTSLKDWLIFSFSILFLMIGVDQSMRYGFAASYWAYMISASLLIWYGYKKKNVDPQPEKKFDNTKKKKASSKK